jgi:hypothetical protein
LQDLGFLAFTLPQVEILMPTKKPCGQELTLEQQLANQALHQRRLRIEHVNSSVKRCRIVKDRIRLWKEGIRDLNRATQHWHTGSAWKRVIAVCHGHRVYESRVE